MLVSVFSCSNKGRRIQGFSLLSSTELIYAFDKIPNTGIFSFYMSVFQMGGEKTSTSESIHF